MRTEKGKSINPDQYVGDKVKIESARIEEMKFGAVVRVESEPLKFKGDDELPEGKSLRASRILGIGKSEKDGSLVIIENSKLEKFLKSKRVVIEREYELGENIEELMGVECVVQKTEDGFLELA